MFPYRDSLITGKCNHEQDGDPSEELQKAVWQNLSLGGYADGDGQGNADEDEGGSNDGVVEHVPIDGQVHPTNHQSEIQGLIKIQNIFLDRYL